jgi:ankyrin repeat protein
MDHVQHSFEHFGLHLAAMAGDDEGIRRALDMGADINGLDKDGRTAVMCAVSGKQSVSLYLHEGSVFTSS